MSNVYGMDALRLSGDFSDLLREAGGVIKSGGVVLAPTDTVYGLVCDARNKAAVRKIFEIKGRSLDKPIGVFVSGMEMAGEYVEISDRQALFLNKVWPGGVAVILRIKNEESRIIRGGSETYSDLSRLLNAGGDTVSVRMPDYDFLLKLIETLDFPLAQTSANVSGEEPMQRVSEMTHGFRGGILPDLTIDGGELLGFASTVVDLSAGDLRMLRIGAIAEDDIMGKWYEK